MASPKRAAVPATIFQNQPLFVPSHSNDYGGKFHRVNRICQSNEIVIVTEQSDARPFLKSSIGKGNARFPRTSY